MTIGGKKTESMGWYHESRSKFLTSIPKTGTYLMRQILRLEWPVPEGTHANFAYEKDDTWYMGRMFISPGKHHIRGHIGHCVPTVQSMKSRDVAVFTFRDPRDTIISWHHYIETPYEGARMLARSQKEIDFAKSRDRIADLIEFLPRVFENYIPWLGEKEIIPIRYEGLINNPHEELEPLAAVLPEPLEYLVARSTMRGGPTYRKATPGDWRDEFQPHHKKAFEAKWGEIMEILGYA